MNCITRRTKFAMLSMAVLCCLVGFSQAVFAKELPIDTASKDYRDGFEVGAQRTRLFSAQMDKLLTDVARDDYHAGFKEGVHYSEDKSAKRLPKDAANKDYKAGFKYGVQEGQHLQKNALQHTGRANYGAGFRAGLLDGAKQGQSSQNGSAKKLPLDTASEDYKAGFNAMVQRARLLSAQLDKLPTDDRRDYYAGFQEGTRYSEDKSAKKLPQDGASETYKAGFKYGVQERQYLITNVVPNMGNANYDAGFKAGKESAIDTTSKDYEAGFKEGRQNTRSMRLQMDKLPTEAARDDYSAGFQEGAHYAKDHLATRLPKDTASEAYKAGFKHGELDGQNLITNVLPNTGRANYDAGFEAGMVDGAKQEQSNQNRSAKKLPIDTASKDYEAGFKDGTQATRSLFFRESSGNALTDTASKDYRAGFVDGMDEGEHPSATKLPKDGASKARSEDYDAGFKNGMREGRSVFVKKFPNDAAHANYKAGFRAGTRHVSDPVLKEINSQIKAAKLRILKIQAAKREAATKSKVKLDGRTSAS